MDVNNPLGMLPEVADVLRQGAVWAELPDDLEARVLSGPAAPAGLADPPGFSGPSGPSGPAGAPPVEVTPLTRTRRPRLLLAAAVGTAVLAAGATAILTADPDAGTMELAGTPLAAQAHAEVQLRDTPSGIKITLDVEGLPPAPAGSYYQGWVKGRSGAVAIGTFHLRAGTDDVVLWSGVDLSDYPTITVTLQVEGAGPASSGRVVLVGEVPPAQR